MKKLKITISLIGVAVTILLMSLRYQCNKIKELKTELHNAKGKIDTVFVPKFYKPKPIPAKEITKPKKVEVFKQDTALRKAVQDSDIVIGVNLQPRKLFRPAKLVVDKITPQGFVYSNHYNATDLKSVSIDQTGNVKITTKKRNLYLKIGIPVAVFGTAGVILYKQNLPPFNNGFFRK
jgi:hypothetical protein